LTIYVFFVIIQGLTRVSKIPCPKGVFGPIVQKEVHKMALKKYELVLVFSLTKGEEAVEALKTKFFDLINKNGTLGEVDEWGKRKLAYAINYETEGYYVIAQFESDENFPAELDRIINITDGVLRSMIVAKGE
jgi:small subunit ribosomal protein S6